jgi:hypothetical protein
LHKTLFAIMTCKNQAWGQHPRTCMWVVFNVIQCNV